MTADRLRFDFNLHRGLKEQEVARIEELVNGWIAEDTSLVTREMPLAEAKAAGELFSTCLLHIADLAVHSTVLTLHNRQGK